MKMLSNNEVVVMISNAEESSKSGKQSEASISSETPDSVSYSFSNYLKVEPPIAQIPELRKRMSSTVEITKLSPSKVPEESLGRRSSFARSANSKSKSRLVEPSYHSSWKLDDDNTRTVELSSPYVKSPSIASPSSKVRASTPKDNASTAPITPKTPLMASLRMGGEDADEVYIDEEDLLQFLHPEEVHNVLQMFAGEVETGKIKKASFCNWVVSSFPFPFSSFSNFKNEGSRLGNSVIAIFPYFTFSSSV
ncbi:hypothetical protein RJ639_026806 [Escallonia herrerae]|uniref:Uncharacterized protein n=1 Tax=Escallonia herrerae TaxID=1293975 RepID=A0AA88X5P9_9ASTE|nr:hypothetical protein RJ639_026806 [Escallonia herrerae]